MSRFYKILCWLCFVHGYGMHDSIVAQCNQNYNWTTWTNFTGNNANGTIQYGGQSIGVNMSANYGFGSTPGIYNFGAFNGFGGSIPNTNVPYTTWSAGPGGTTTMCFTETVTNPVLLLASLGNPSQHVTLTFSLPYVLVYDGGGMTYINSTTILGAEGYAIIEFPGNFDCVTIYSTTPEHYTNITWGLHPPLFQVDIAGEPEACNQVHLTASGGTSYAWSGGEYPGQPQNTFTTSGNYFLTVTDAAGCSVLTSVDVEVFEEEAIYLNNEICQGIPYFFEGVPVSESGTYVSTLQTVNGCDSTITLDLVVYPSYSFNQVDSICQGSTFSFFGQQLDQPGIYRHEEQTIHGCDSIYQLQLNTLPTSFVNLQHQLCPGDTMLFNASPLTSSGVYTALFANQWGCDSIVSLKLTVPDPIATSIDSTICQRDSVHFQNQLLSNSGIYRAILNASSGCDSLVVLNLQVTETAVTNQDAFICAGEGYTFYGRLLTNPGVYTQRFIGSSQCDSLVVLQLEVLPVVSSSAVVQLCAGESHIFHGRTLVTAGIYTDTLLSVNGCDSVVRLELSYYPVFSNHMQVTICEGETYSFLGENYSQAGMYQKILTSQMGCDSLILLQLNITPLPVAYRKVAICEGEVYSFYETQLSKPGMYQDTFAVAGSCDSVVILSLEVWKPAVTRQSADICQGETYSFMGNEVTMAGEYTTRLTTDKGCDSTIVLDVSVHPVYSRHLFLENCVGEVVEAEGQSFTTPVTKLFSYKTAAGCDSLVTVSVDFYPVYEFVEKIESRSSFTWSVNQKTYESSGVYIAPFTSTDGCDSLHVLDLRIIPFKSWFAPNIMTSLGQNSRFTIYGNNQLEEILILRIFDRWGNKVAILKNLPPNDGSLGWDGWFQDGMALPGVYVYAAELLWKDGSSIHVSGNVTLMR